MAKNEAWTSVFLVLNLVLVKVIVVAFSFIKIANATQFAVS